MFKVIGRWGSHVKARIRIPFISSLFGSKSNSYGGIDDDEEEIFSDAKEDLSDTEEDLTLVKATGNGHLDTANAGTSGQDAPDAARANGHTDTGTSGGSEEVLADLSLHKGDDTISSHSEESGGEHSDDEHNDHHDTHSDKKKIIKSEGKANGMTKSSSTSTFKKVHRRISSLTQKQYNKFDTNKENGDKVARSVSESHVDDGTETTDDKTESKTNGMPKSPSTSTFKKVHRRISSLTQKQYNKLDSNANKDDVDKLVQPDSDSHAESSVEITEDTPDSKTNGMTKSSSTSTFKKVHKRISSLTQKPYVKFDNNSNNDDVDNLVQSDSDSHVDDSTEITKETRSEKKPSRRKKAAKRARRTLRGSWKWLKRGMMGYAHAFNAPTMFISSVSGAAATRRTY